MGRYLGYHSFLLTSGLLMFGVAKAGGQARDTIPVSLLRQVTAVAENYRTGRVAFVAACQEPPRILGVFDTQREAEAASSAAGNCFSLAIRTLPQDPVTVPASLARRLAEAADGYRTGEPVWIVARTQFDHHILGVFPDLPGAIRAGQDSFPDYRVWGPYRTPQDFGRNPLFFWCWHYRPTMWDCPPDRPPVDIRDIDSIRVTVFPRGRDIYSRRFSPWQVDALFFDFAAIEKFVIPYYTQLFGADYGARLRAALAEYAQRAQPR